MVANRVSATARARVGGNVPTPGRVVSGRTARVAKLADAGGLNPPSTHVECGFKSRPGHIYLGFCVRKDTVFATLRCERSQNLFSLDDI